MDINWFPGHMASATRKIKEIKPLDLVIEVIDARAIRTSKNNQLLNELNKPKLTIALKSDLTDESTLNIPNDVLVCSTKEWQDKKKIINTLYDYFNPKIEKLKEKGLLIPQFYILVVGLPNIGKSSLINFITEYNTKTIVQNKAGTTRRNQMVKINDNLFLYDTPGIMVKKIDNDNQGYILALLNLIKKEVIPLEKTCEWAFNFYVNNYRKEFFDYFPNPFSISFSDFIEYLCRKYQFITEGGIHDKPRALDFFFNTIKDNKICKVNYEK